MEELKNVYKGTELKFILTIDADGFSMVDDDFKIRLSTNDGRKYIEITKEQMAVDEDDNYIFMFDTSCLGTGIVTMTTFAYVPDEDFDDNLRTEVDKIAICRIM